MGVDWYPCNACRETFPDCGEYWRCGNCGTMWCSEDCSNKHGYKQVDNEELDSCHFCRGEDASDRTLLEFALEILKVSRKDLIADLNKSLEAKKQKKKKRSS